MKIFAIIVTYKGQQWYDRCFTSLRNSSIPVQTIVVDNASDDGTVEYIRENFPEIHLIESKENLGFGRANNLAMRYALDNGCDYVFLLNQDAWLDDSDTLKNLVEIYERHPEYGILSPMHLNIDKTKLLMRCFSSQPGNEKLISDLYLQSLDKVYETTYIHAAAWMLSRQTLLMVGGFDPIYFHYGEDDNYMHRVLYHGLKIGVCPSTCIVHDHQDSKISNEVRERRELQSMLVDWTNINNTFFFNKTIFYYLRKYIIYLFSQKKYLKTITKKKLSFCFKMKKSIVFSRNINVKKGSSWL